MAETSKQALAFDIYYAMGKNGGKRSFRAVSEHPKINKSITTINKWAQEFNWKERIAERDARNNKAMFDKTDEDIVNTLTNYRKVIKGSIGAYISDLKDGRVKINSPSDFIKLVELDLKLQEIMIENTKINDNNDNKENDNSDTKELANSMRELMDKYDGGDTNE